MKNVETYNATEPARLPQETVEPVSILLVDDREENLVALEAVLRDPSYRLFKANSGDDALRYLLEHIPALILMDVQMPGLDGYETAAIIKSNPRTRDVPIMFVTAINTDERFVHRGYEYGAIDYIYKPFDSHVLRSKVAVLADLHRKTERLLKAERLLRENEGLERERRIAELELRSLRREQIEQKRYRNLVEGIEHGFVWAASPQTMALSFVSPSAQRLTGFAADDWLSDPGFFFRHLPEEDQPAFRAAIERATSASGEVQLEHRLQRANGQTAWFHTGLRLSSRPDGGGSELRGLSVDITPLKQAETTLAQAKKRSDILGQASLLLAESLDYTEPLAALVKYLREKACDFCVLECFDLPQELTLLASGDEARDAELTAAFRYAPRRLTPAEIAGWLEAPSKHWPRLDTEALEALFGPGPRAAASRSVPLFSAIQVALTLHGKFLGLLTLGFAREGLSEVDSSLAEDLAYRISSALENASLFQKAESAIRLRDEFLSIASHELRTPLTPLKIRVQQMQRLLSNPDGNGYTPEQLQKTVETCNRQIERLSKLIDDLLDISRISRGKLSLHPEKFDVAELIGDILSRFSGPLEAAGCTAKLETQGDLSVNLDLSRIEQVFVNLLSNAIKYAPGLPIEISARAVDGLVEVSFCDHGMGIAEEDQARIFQRFERAVSSNHFGGLGLGLYIVSQILAAHGGSIRVVSHPGQGSTFTVRLPRAVRAENPKEGSVDLPA